MISLRDSPSGSSSPSIAPSAAQHACKQDLRLENALRGDNRHCHYINALHKKFNGKSGPQRTMN
jgi:hypothetical protein